MKNILIITGTRPEVIKMAPIIKQGQKDNEIQVIHADSNQHADYNMNHMFLDELSLPFPDFVLKPDNENFYRQFSSIYYQISQIIEKSDPNIVLSQGDTNTVLLSALASKHQDKIFGHVEAGIRSFDLNMPEEINRRIADICANLHFCPTNLSAVNLLFERIEPERIFITGNTVVDAMNGIKDLINIRKKSIRESLMTDGFLGYVLLTLHRPSNADNKSNLSSLIRSIEGLPDFFFIFPLHPRTRNNLENFGLLKSLERQKNVKIINPLGYLDFLSLLLEVDIIVTDSGGVQEECYCLNKKCLTLRRNTERPETLISGIHELCNLSPPFFQKKFKRIFSSKHGSKNNLMIGNGTAANQIISVIKSIRENDLIFKTPDLPEWQDYQHKIVKIKEEISVQDFEKSRNRRIQIIYDRNGNPRIPDRKYLLRTGNQIVTIGMI